MFILTTFLPVQSCSKSCWQKGCTAVEQSVRTERDSPTSCAQNKNNKNKNWAKRIKNDLEKPSDSIVLQNGSITALASLEKKLRKPVLITCTNLSPNSPQEVVPK